MCAIVGLVKRPGREFNYSYSSRETVFEMLEKMVHRGPDNFGYIEHENVALGHRRLSVVGLEDARQPLSDGRVDIAVNGEIYRYEHLKNDFFPCKKWMTSSDSEVLIPLYEWFGIDKMLDLIDGEFAFLLNDREKHILYAVRDRFGVKPLAYRESNVGVEFASEVRGFLGEKRWSLDALCTGLAMHYPSLKTTIADGIFNVLPGHYLAVDTETGKILGDVQWWKPTWPKVKREDESTSIGRFRILLFNAVKARMRADAKWCVSLSGGVDSSSVLGVASALSTNPIDSFTVSFPDAGELAYNELETARRTAAALGSTLHEVEMPAARMLELLESAVLAGEGFAVNGHISCKHALAKAVHDAGFKAMLVGEGADECLFGYSHLKLDQFGADGTANQMMSGTETPCGDLLMPEKLAALPYIPSFLKAKLSSGKMIASLLDRDFRETFTSHALAGQEDILKRAMALGSCPAEMTTAAWLSTAFPTYICKVLGDSQEMSSSVEARLPFLDRELFEFASSLSMKLKTAPSFEKTVLREAVKGIVPDEVRLRPKQPFQAPPMSFLLPQSKWSEFVDLCTSSSGVFDNAKLKDFATSVQNLPLQRQIEAEPILMLAASCAILSRNFKL